MLNLEYLNLKIRRDMLRNLWLTLHEHREYDVHVEQGHLVGVSDVVEDGIQYDMSEFDWCESDDTLGIYI